MAAQKGTTVTVEGLFSNLPVRRRELERNIKREWGKVIGLLNQYACIKTGVKFTVSQQPTKGKRIALFSTKGNPTTRENIINIFGSKAMATLLAIDLVFDLHPTVSLATSQVLGHNYDACYQVRVRGHISRPSHGEGRQTPDRQMFYVNGRPCGLPQVAKVFNEVYKAYNSNQSPFILADVLLDTHLYDVNVSPDKRTILLHDQGQMLENLRQALMEKFEDQDFCIPTGQLLATTKPNLARNSTSSGPTSGLMSKGELESHDADPRLMLEDASRSGQEVRANGMPCEEQIITHSGEHFDALNGSNIHIQASSPRKGPTPTNIAEVNIAFPQKRIDPPDSNTGQVLSFSLGKNNVPLPPKSPSEDSVKSDQSQRFKSDDPLPGFTDVGALLREGHSFSQSHVGLVSRGEGSARDSRFTRRGKPHANIVIGSGTMMPPKPKVSVSDVARLGRASGTPFEGRLSQQFSAGRRLHDSDTQQPAVRRNPDSNDDEASENSVEPIIVKPDIGSVSSDFELGSASPADSDVFPDQDDQNDPGPAKIFVEKRAGTFATGIRSKGTTIQLTQHICTSEVSVSKLRSRWSRRLQAQFCGTRVQSGAVQSLDTPDAEQKLSLVISKGDFDTMRIVGQFNLGFIIAVRPSRCRSPDEVAEDDDLFIIDQHASDEKYNFERLQAETIVQSQMLVRKMKLELTALEEEIVMNNLDALEANGFRVEINGDDEAPTGSRCLLTALPLSRETTFSVTDLQELITLLGDPESTSGGVLPRPSRVRKMFAMRACRSSIMIGKALAIPQMERVVRHMGSLDKPWNCPHGRPTMRHLCGLQLWDDGGWRGDC